VQRDDHGRLDELMKWLELPGLENREELWREFVQQTTTHAFAEETVLFPMARRALGDEGDALTTRVEAEHQRINELLASIEKDWPERFDVDSRLCEVFTLIRDDARTEEDVLLPKLVAAGVDLEDLVFGWETVASTAPTRPHPHAARRPPGNLLAAPVLSVVDRLRDVVRKKRSWL
jgi:hemerythrin superfamily protein